MYIKHFLLCTSFVLLLFGFYACEKGTSMLTKELKNSTQNQKLNNDRTLVAILLTDDVLQFGKTDLLINELLKKEQLNIESIDNNIGQFAFWNWDASEGFKIIENNNDKSTLKIDDLELKKEFATLSHLTTFKNTPVEIFNYSLNEPNDVLSRITYKGGIGFIIVSTVGRPPSDFFSF